MTSRSVSLTSQGFLGVTPVVLSGTIVAKIPSFTPKLPVKSVTVSARCCEVRSGGPFTSAAEKVLWEKQKVIWAAATEGGYEEIGNWQRPFSISIPVEAVETATSVQTFKEWKATWKIEVVFEHLPIQYVGHQITKTLLLDLHNHRAPGLAPPSPPSPVIVGTGSSSTAIRISPLHGAFGPEDTFTVTLHARPAEPGTVVKKATMVLERRVEFLEPSRESSPEHKRSFFRRSLSPHPSYARLPSDGEGSVSSSSEHETRAEVTRLLEVVSDAEPEADGYRCSLSATLPKRGHKWSTGETCRTSVASITFELKVKVSIKQGRKACQDYSCPIIPIVLIGTSAGERAEAQAHADAPKPVAAKRRLRSSRRGLYLQEGTVDISEPAAAPSRRRHKSGSSPLPIHTGDIPDIRPILLPPDQPPESRSISFAFPDPDNTLAPISSLLHPFYPSPPETVREFESYSILKRYQHGGRRISTTTSEEEEAQPERSRQKTTFEPFDFRAPLPSLDTLGLGLPAIPDGARPDRRPRTAPIHSTFSAPRAVPPPLSGVISSGLESDQPTARPVTSQVVSRHTITTTTSSSTTAASPFSSFAFALPNSPRK